MIRTIFALTCLAIALVPYLFPDPPTHLEVSAERTICLPAPGEIAHIDDKGWCAITRKGRVVTRMQLSLREE